MRVLVIDDEADNAVTLCELLDLCGWEVRCAYSGKEGAEAALDYLPDVVLCDLAMPEVTGYEVMRRLRSQPQLSHTRWIAHTGFHDPTTHRECLHAGFEAVIVKPANLDRLLELLEREPARGGRDKAQGVSDAAGGFRRRSETG